MRYRLRTLLIVVALLAVSLSIWRRIQDCKRLAHEHHYSSLRAGYTAIKMQASSFDRATMTTAYPYWEDSIRHSQLADHYIEVTKKPWIMFLPPPTVSTPPQLPAEDAALRAWWEKHVAKHVTYNGLDRHWGSYFDAAVSDRNLALFNAHPDSFNRFLALTEPELFEDGDYLRPRLPPDEN